MATPTLVLTLFWGSFLSSSHHRSTKQGETRLSQSQNTKYPLFSSFISQSELIFRAQARINAQQNKEGRGCQKVRISYLSFSHQPVWDHISSWLTRRLINDCDQTIVCSTERNLRPRSGVENLCQRCWKERQSTIGPQTLRSTLDVDKTVSNCATKEEDSGAKGCFAHIGDILGIIWSNTIRACGVALFDTALF